MEQTVALSFSLLVEAIVLWQYTSNLFIPSHSNRQKLFLLVGLYTLLFLFSLLGITWFNIMLYFIASVTYIYSQFQINLLLACFHSGILTAIMGLSELSILGTISQFAPNFPIDTKIGLVLYMIFSKMLFFVIVYLLSHFFRRREYPYDSSLNYTDFVLILIPISCIFIMITFFIIEERCNLHPPIDVMVTVSAVFLLLINLLVFGINQYNYRRNIEFTNMQLLLQKEADSSKYYKMLLSQTENRNILVHDIKKHLQSIKLLNERKESDKINAYICQLLDSSELKEPSRLCDNEILNAILGRYQRQCNNKHICFQADIRSGILNDISPHDITSLFCNLLDNCVQATENIPDSFIEITAKRKENSPFIVIVTINSCRTAPTYGTDQLPVSNKGDARRHGYGIKSIKKIAKQHGGDLQTYYDNASATFHTILTLKV